MHGSRLLRSKIVLLLGIAAVIYVTVSVVSEYRRRQAVQEEIRGIENEITALELQRTRLSTLLEHAETPDFLEREARLRLGLQKPGEQVLIVPEGTVIAPSPASPNATAPPDSNATRWWKAIFP